MRISDWSSDVCSSDLGHAGAGSRRLMPNRQPHLLYIDDDLALCRLVEVGFRRLGYRVSTAGSGADGIERLQPGHDVDVVALDHHMDGLNGLETLALLQPLSDPPPVVFVTGQVERSEARRVGKGCVSTC